MTSRDRVLSVYPTAYVQPCYGMPNVDIRYSLPSQIFPGQQRKGYFAGEGATEEEAWDDAASKLPAGETASAPIAGTRPQRWYVWVGNEPLKEIVFASLSEARAVCEANSGYVFIGDNAAVERELAIRSAVPEPVPPGGAADLTLVLRLDAETGAFVGKCLERGVYSQGSTMEEAALATLSAVRLSDEFAASKGGGK